MNLSLKNGMVYQSTKDYKFLQVIEALTVITLTSVLGFCWNVSRPHLLFMASLCYQRNTTQCIEKKTFLYFLSSLSYIYNLIKVYIGTKYLRILICFFDREIIVIHLLMSFLNVLALIMHVYFWINVLVFKKTKLSLSNEAESNFITIGV